MALKHLGYIDLPNHIGQGGFDHAAVDRGRALLFVAHTANNAVDVVSTRSGAYVRSIEGLKGVAGALVDEPLGLVFTSNRGEDSVGIISSGALGDVGKIPVGHRPNGLAYDADRRLLLCANVGDPSAGRAPSVTLVDVSARAPIVTIPMPGRTRWAMFDPDQQLFFVNIADPPLIVEIDPRAPITIGRRISVPARGPHGLDLDASRHCLYCACDDGTLVSLDSRSGEVLNTLSLSGAPDVVFLNRALAHLYVAIGDPGVIDVIDVAGWRRLEVVPTEAGAHTIALDEATNLIYAFLPKTHRASVFLDALTSTSGTHG